MKPTAPVKRNLSRCPFCLVYNFRPVLNFALFSKVRKYEIKGAVSRYSVIFCTFARAKNGCCSRRCHGYQLGQPREQLHRPSRVEQMAFSSSNCRFPRPSLVAAIIFPHTKWLPKITDYRDTAALRCPATLL